MFFLSKTLMVMLNLEVGMRHKRWCCSANVCLSVEGCTWIKFFDGNDDASAGDVALEMVFVYLLKSPPCAAASAEINLDPSSRKLVFFYRFLLSLFTPPFTLSLHFHFLSFL